MEKSFLVLFFKKELLLYYLLAGLVVAPVLSVTVPVLGDFPNHLARVHILEGLQNHSSLARFYAPAGRLVPYQAMDVMMAGLRLVLPIYAAGRVFLALCLLVPPAAAASLRYAATGRVGLLPAAGFLLSYNFLLSRGFVDFVLAVGLAMALFAVWRLMAGGAPWRRCAVGGVGLALVFLGHAYAGVTYCLLVAGDQVAAAARRRFHPAFEVAREWGWAAAQAVPCLGLVAVFGASGSFGGAAQTHFGDATRKMAAFFTPVLFPAPGWILALFGLLPIAVLALLAARKVRIAPALVGPAIAVALAAAAAPNVLFNAWATDMRLPLVLYVVVLAGLLPAREVGPRWSSVLVAGLIGLVAVRSAGAFALLQTLDAQAAQVRGLVQAMPNGERLLVVDDGDTNGTLRQADSVLTDHLGMLAVLERDAFVPFLLTGATPVEPRAGFVSSSSPNARPVTLAQLRDGAEHPDGAGPPPSYGNGGHVYWLGWRRKFDYVLRLHFGAPAMMPAGLREVASVPIATLYQNAEMK